jgi:hypothetical protein
MADGVVSSRDTQVSVFYVVFGLSLGPEAVAALIIVKWLETCQSQ